MICCGQYGKTNIVRMRIEKGVYVFDVEVVGAAEHTDAKVAAPQCRALGSKQTGFPTLVRP